MKMENLETFLYANVILQEPKLEYDFKKLMEKEEFFKLLREGVTKKEEEKKQ